MGCGDLDGAASKKGEVFSDHLNPGNDLTIPPRKSGNEFTRATDLYGPSRIRQGSYLASSDIVPWSGSWYPYSDDRLFRDSNSPLQKYDRYVRRLGNAPSRAADYERTHFFHPDAENWSGRCDAWALASLLVPEPHLSRPVSLNGVQFTNEDLKALLILSYEQVEDLVQFGQRYNGDYKSAPEDIYPDQFHRVLEKELFDRRRPFIMDKDPGIQVWNTPIFKAEVEIEIDAVNTQLFHVHTVLEGAQPSDFSPNPEDPRPYILFEYTYDLYGEPQSDGSLEVKYGLWTGDSIRNHPDFVWTLPEKIIRKSRNKEIDPRIVDEIVKLATTRNPVSF